MRACRRVLIFRGVLCACLCAFYVQMMEVNRILGQLWAGVGDAERQPYVESAARLREVWDREHPEQAAKNAAAGGSGSGRKKRRTNNGAAAMMEQQQQIHEEDSDDMSESAAAAAAAHYARASPASASPSSSAPTPLPEVDRELALQLHTSIARIISTMRAMLVCS